MWNTCMYVEHVGIAVVNKVHRQVRRDCITAHYMYMYMYIVTYTVTIPTYMYMYVSTCSCSRYLSKSGLQLHALYLCRDGYVWQCRVL